MPEAGPALPRFPVDFKTVLLAHLPEGVPAPGDAAIDRMERHARLLLRWGRLTSLTSITDPEEIVRRHFCESLLCLPWIAPGAAVLDLGTGAGFPGLPVQMARADREGGSLTLVEPNGRKAEFLRAVVAETGLENVSVIEAHVRTDREWDELVRGKTVDALLARAIPDPAAWALRTARLVAPHGRGLFFAGDDVRAAIEGRLADKSLALAASVLVPGTRASWLLVLQRTDPA